MDMMNALTLQNAHSSSREGAANLLQKKLQAMSEKAENIDPATMAKIDGAAKDYESVFISEMLNHMFKDVSFAPMFGGNGASEVFKSHLMQEYGKILSEQGGIGLAQDLKSQLIELQARNVSE